MRVKKTNIKNEYIQAAGTYIRNFAKENIPPQDLSHLFLETDYPIVLKNEEQNKKYPAISDEVIHFRKIVIVSDGYDFTKKQSLLADLPKDVAILAINGALKSWKLGKERSVNAYVINNPYAEAMHFLPAAYFPVCLASIRANYEFCKRYKGDVYIYYPSPSQGFGHKIIGEYCIDDYRNPVCACIGLAWQFGVEKLLLFCCDDSFKEKRDFATQLPNGLWTYPQHLQSRDIIDANLYWLTHQEERKIAVADCSCGGDYVNAPYITDNEVKDFFKDEDK